MIPSGNTPSSICILRLSALGDATHVVPVVRALQQAWPNTRITWIIGVPEHRLLQDLNGVEFIVFNKRGGWKAVGELRQALKHRSFDVLLQMQVAARANLLSRLIKAPIRVGWDRSRSRDLHHWFSNRKIAEIPFQHQVQGFLEFPRKLGIPVEQPNWNIPIRQEAIDWASDQLSPNRRSLVISPCSSHPSRNWRSENYASVADFAIRELGMEVILSGGPSPLEQTTATRIQQAMSLPCTNLVGKDTLEQSKAMLKLADVVISPDSGPVHIASSFGTPVLGLYAATWSRRSGPYNSLDLCVDRFPEAARKFRNSEPESLRWGTRIEVPGVMELIDADSVKKQLAGWISSAGLTRSVTET